MGWPAVAPMILILINALWIHASAATEYASAARSLKAFELSITSESWVGEVSGEPGRLYGRCSLPSAMSPDDGTDKETQCTNSLGCVPVLTVSQDLSARNIFERVGMCVEFPPGAEINDVKRLPSAYFFDSLYESPLPIGYFPFTFENVTSWPFPSFQGSLGGAGFVDDDVFGSALQCNKGAVELPNVAYTTNGEFTVNLWIKADLPGERTGIEYILSHKKLDANEGDKHNPQIQVYLPGESLQGILRAQVKDANDLDDSLKVLSFVDSDGEVGSSRDRETPEDMANVHDGEWHMITVTSKAMGEKGLFLYIDGIVVGELNSQEHENGSDDIQVSGGDPLDLDGPINLCGLASGSTDEFFEGRLAHLALFDQSLSPERVKDMFETLVATRIQLDGKEGAESAPKARSGNSCLFPAIYKGEVVHNCVPREATKECPTSGGVWEECSFFSSEEVDFFQISDAKGPDDEAVIVTVDGDACEFPMYYAGIAHFECIDLHGTPSCYTNSGVWKECADPSAQKAATAPDSSQVSRKTIHGEDCMFPFDYQGEIFEDCTDIFGDWSCRIATGEYFPCAVERNPATEYRYNSTAPIISRVTKTGETCFFPLWYGEDSIADCFPEAGGVVSCPTLEGEIKACEALRLTIDGNPCAIPFFFEGEEHYDCADHAGMSICMTADGDIAQCAPFSSLPQPASGDEGLHIVTGRGTVSEENCAFPFWYGGKLMSDCVAEDGVEYCQTGDGIWKECLPQIFMEDGRKCSIPFHHEEEFHFDCVVVDGSYQCPSASDEPWGKCEGYVYVPMPEPSSEFDDLEEDESVDFLESVIEEGSSEVLSTEDHSVGPSQAGSPQSWIGKLTNAPGRELGECRLPEVYPPAAGQKTAPECASDKLSCVPIRSSSESMHGRKGACFQFPGQADNSTGYIFDAGKDMPVPQAYFPLTHGSVDSWPFDHYKGKAGGQKFVADDVFGSVLQCTKGTVELPSIPYAASGRFSINMWVKTDKAAGGIGFEYIFSHMKEGATAGFRGASQVIELNIRRVLYPQPYVSIQLYLPRRPFPSHGLLRAVVKDNDDEADGRASDSFVDSDGQIGNNVERELASNHVDFYDQLWHMVTITSGEDGAKGFKLYVDGILAGEMGAKDVSVEDGSKMIDLQVTGGNPIDLGGKIHLCGRAVDSELRFFSGFIAHLAAFTSPLSAEHVAELYETFMATKSQSEGRPLESTQLKTSDGGTCLFPALHKGKWVDMCVDIDGVQKCPSGPGTWVECASEKLGSVAKYVTVDDEPCELPIYYNGSLHNECISIDGVPMCHAANGPWKECRSATDISVERWDPASWEEQHGTHRFDVAAYEESAAKSKAANDGPDIKTHELSEDILNHDGRFETIDGEECEFPVFYAGALHYRCIPIDGVPKCHPPGGAWKKCRPKLQQQQEEEEERKEEEEEKEESREKEEAPPAEGISKLAKQVTQDPNTVFAHNPDAPALTRVTVDGDQCLFPFWYGEESISGCFMDDGKQKCPTRDGSVKECSPVRLTVDGLSCAMPFALDGREHSDCFAIKGVEHCRTSDGDLKRCALRSNEKPQSDEYKIVTARATVKGANCALPFWYKGKLVSDCVRSDANEFCQTMFGEWEECAPQKFTVDGKKCSIPFHYEGDNYFDCINLDGVRKCPTAAQEAATFAECSSEKSGVGRSKTG